MAITRVQGTGRVSASATTSVSLTFATPPTVGNSLLVEVIAYKSGGAGLPPTGCTDNRGHTYAQATQLFTGNIATAIYALPIIATSAAPFTVTVTYGGTAYFEAAAIEISGVGTGLAVDQVVNLSGSGTIVSPGTTPTLTASEVVVAAVHAISANQASLVVQPVSPTWTEEFENLNYSATVAGEGDTRILTGAAGTTQTCSWTAATSASWGAALAVFKGSAPSDASVLGATRASTAVLFPGTVVLPASSPILVTQLAAEILNVVPASPLAVTQVAAEIVHALYPEPNDARVTQLVCELLIIPRRVSYTCPADFPIDPI